MLKIRIIVVDKTRSSFLKEGEDFYLKRLKHYAQVDWVEAKPVPIKKGRVKKGGVQKGSAQNTKIDSKVLSGEASNIMKKILPGDYLIALDRSGRQKDSIELSQMLDKLSLHSRNIDFIIGGPLGLDKDILTKADMVLSFSKMTFTHEMSRMILLEQLYRAMTILKGEQYHK